MFKRKGQPETSSEPLRALVSDLVVRVADCVARVDSLETRWKDAQDQLRRSYQRLEKAGQRLENVPEPEHPTPVVHEHGRGFAEKLRQLKGA